MTIIRTLAALLVSGLALAGCASTGGSTASPSASAPTTNASSSSPVPGASTASAPAAAASGGTVSIKDFAYTVPASVSPGATITVVNKDSEAHTVTSDAGGAFDDAVPPGSTTSFTAPSAPGRYPLHCKYHANMHAVLVVT